MNDDSTNNIFWPIVKFSEIILHATHFCSIQRYFRGVVRIFKELHKWPEINCYWSQYTLISVDLTDIITSNITNQNNIHSMCIFSALGSGHSKDLMDIHYPTISRRKWLKKKESPLTPPKSRLTWAMRMSHLVVIKSNSSSIIIFPYQWSAKT